MIAAMSAPKPPLDSVLERLLGEFRARLRATIARRCPPRLGLDADDVEQEVRIRLWKVLASEKVIVHPASYLHQVTLSVIVDLLRRRRARPDSDPAEEYEAVADRTTSSGSDTPQRVAENAAAAGAVMGVIATLPERRRRPVQLHLQGFSTMQIGVLLGISEAAARNLVYRGLDELRVQLRAQGWSDD